MFGVCSGGTTLFGHQPMLCITNVGSDPLPHLMPFAWLHFCSQRAALRNSSDAAEGGTAQEKQARRPEQRYAMVSSPGSRGGAAVVA